MKIIDLDEIAPGRFLIHNVKVRGVLRGTGDIDGNNFVLTDWRRDSWLYKLEVAGFNVRTVESRLAELPRLPTDLERGPERFRPLATSKEQWAAFDGQRLRWRDLPVREQAGQTGVWLLLNEPVRRRKSRSGGEYFVSQAQGDGLNLHPVSDEVALLHAYGLLANSRQRAVVRFIRTKEGYQIEGSPLLPPRHAAVLDVLSSTSQPWTFPPISTAFAEQIFDALVIRLEEIAGDERTAPSPPSTAQNPRPKGPKTKRS